MILAALHLVGYVSTGLAAYRAVPAVTRRRRSRKRRDLFVRITKLEAELGLGVYWAKDDLGALKPMLSRPEVWSYPSLRDYAFRCYGCEAIVRYANYDKRPKRGVRDESHLFCNACLPETIRP